METLSDRLAANIADVKKTDIRNVRTVITKSLLSRRSQNLVTPTLFKCQQKFHQMSITLMVNILTKPVMTVIIQLFSYAIPERVWVKLYVKLVPLLFNFF